MLRHKDLDDILPSPCQVVPSISQDCGNFAFCTPSSLVNYENYDSYFGPSPIYLIHQSELESMQVADLIQDGYTPPQSHTQEANITSTTNDRSNGTNLERSQVEVSDTQLTSNSNNLLFTPVISTLRTAEDDQDGRLVETILDVLCSEEDTFDEFSHQRELSRDEFSENKSQTIDSEKHVNDEDMFAKQGDDFRFSDGVDWLQNV